MVYKNYMGGVWIECDSKKTFQSTNPAHSGQVVGEFQDSTVIDINRAVSFAKDSSTNSKANPSFLTNAKTNSLSFFNG